MSLIRNIVVKVGADISGLSSSMSKAKNDMQENINKMIDAGKALAIAGAASFTALAAKGVEAASSLNEIQNVVDVAFGKSAEQVDAWAQSAISSYGLSEESALQYAGTMKAMFSGMGVASGQANQMSESIADLAGDMASFYNMSTDDAFSKLQSGIAGQAKPLRDLGINMSTANLQAYALSQGIRTAYANMSQGEQTMLRYNYIMQATSMSQGDFARTSGSYANQMRVFQANFEEMTASLGQAVIPLIQAALPWINMFIQYVITAATVFTKWIDGLFGIKVQTANAAQATATLATAQNSMASGADDATASSNSLAAAQNNVAGGIDKVTQAAKNAKAAVSGIDELNILQSPQAADTGSTGAAGTGTGGGGGAIATPNIPTPNVATPQANINVGVVGADKLAAFKKALQDAWGWVVKNQDAIKSVASIIGIFFLPALLKSIGELGVEGVKAFAAGAKAILDYGLNGWKAVASMEASAEAWVAEKLQIIENTAAKAANAIAEKASAAAKYVLSGALWDDVTAWVAEKAQIVEDTAAKLANKIATVASTVETGAAAAAQYVMSGALWETISAWVAGKIELVAGTAATIAQNIATTASAVATKAAAAGQWLLNAAMEANPIGLIIAAVVALIAIFVLLWNNNKGFRDFWISCWAGIKAAWDSFANGISSAWHNILVPFGNFLWDLFISRFQSMFSTVSSVINNIKQVFNGLYNFIAGAFTGNWNRAFEGLRNIVGGVMGGIGGLVKAPINSIVDGMNSVIRSVNSVARTAAKVPGLGWLAGVQIPQIPHLAEGGIIDKPTVAMIGEAGTEAIVPLKNTGFVNTLAQAVTTAVQGGGKTGTNGDINVTMQIDGNTFGKLCVKAINAQTRKLGVNPLYI